jgi:RES domain-containing protein
VICFRQSRYRTPLRTSFQPQTRPGRFHRGTEPEPTQYLCAHPLGPHAEAMRLFDAKTVDVARTLDLRTWAVHLTTDGLVEVPFSDELVADDYAACQVLADTLRAEGHAGAIVPSAALPGTRNVVLFGGRVTSPYEQVEVRPFELRASITGEHGSALASLVRLVRFRGASHPGGEFVFREPSWAVI